jgi:hypothetical protein
MLPAPCWFLASLAFWSWRWRRNIHPKLRLTCNRLYGAMTQKRHCFVCYDFRHFSPEWRTCSMYAFGRSAVPIIQLLSSFPHVLCVPTISPRAATRTSPAWMSVVFRECGGNALLCRREAPRPRDSVTDLDVLQFANWESSDTGEVVMRVFLTSTHNEHVVRCCWQFNGCVRI